jgi:putative endonuclease
MGRSRVALGEWGEAKVARHYESAGYEVLDRNWRVRGGELDLVLARGDEIIFCEVKTRSSHRFGAAVEAVGPRKQRFLRRTAVSWLDAHDRRGRLRFDVVAVTGGRIEVVEAAF